MNILAKLSLDEPLPRVFVLRAPHDDDNLKTQELAIFLVEVIKRYYKPGDRVVVEDDASKPLSDLRVNQIPGLDLTKYAISGWYDPELVKRTQAILEEIKPILTAINQISDLGAETHVDTDKRYHQLFQFSLKFQGKHTEWQTVKWEDLQTSKSSKQFQAAQKKLIANCQLGTLLLRYKFVVTTFDQSQRHLITTANQLLDAGVNTVFLLMGRIHGKSRHLKGLQRSYVSIDPLKGRIKIKNNNNDTIFKKFSKALAHFLT